MRNDSISINLRRLRTARGLSQLEVADIANISRTGYSNIERGKVTPHVSTLRKIAPALNVKLKDLVAPVKEMRAFRFRALKKMKGHELIIAEVANWLDKYNYLENVLGAKRRYLFRELSTELGNYPNMDERAVYAASRSREILGLEPDEPIRNINSLLGSAGVKVFPIERATDGFFGLSVAERDGGPAIVVNVGERIPVERWIFCAVHELGHLVLHLDSFDGWYAEENKAQEDEANTFAGNFLMPNEVFKKEWKSTYGLRFYDRVLKIKRIFFVSYATVLCRLIDLDIMERNKAFAFFKNEYLQRTGRSLKKRDEPSALPPDVFVCEYSEPYRANEPERLTKYDFVESRFHSLVRKAIELDEISLSRGAEILGIPLEEMRELVSDWVVDKAVM